MGFCTIVPMSAWFQLILLADMVTSGVVPGLVMFQMKAHEKRGTVITDTLSR
jgi:hypothetical protein